jgi:hypothetical protein
MRSEFFVPGAEEARQQNIHNIFKDAINRLPLSQCQLAREPLTGRLEFRPPDGQVFEASGMTTEGEIVECFRGHGLMITVNGYQFGRPFRDIYISEGKDYDVEILVLGQLGAYIWPTNSEYFDEQNRHIYEYDLPPNDIQYGYSQVISSIDNMTIKLVSSEDKPQGLTVVTIDEVWEKYKDELWVPSVGLSLESSVAYLEAGLSLPDKGVEYKFSEDERLALMRDRRWLGIPYDDDPLRDLQIAKTGNIISALTEAIEGKHLQVPKSMKEQEEQNKKRTNQMIIENRADKLKGSLAIIIESAPLGMIVDKHAPIRWFEDELEQLERDLEVDIF